MLWFVKPGSCDSSQKYEEIRDQPRWQSRKTLGSPPLMGTPKSQPFTEQPSTKKTRSYQKRPSTTKDIKRNHNKMGRRG